MFLNYKKKKNSCLFLFALTYQKVPLFQNIIKKKKSPMFNFDYIRKRQKFYSQYFECQH